MTGKIFAAALAVLLAFGCSDPPTTATDDFDADAVSFGRGNDQGARIWLPDPACAVIDATGALYGADCRMQVATPSSNNNAMAMTQASGVPNATGEVVQWGPADPGWELAGILALYFGIDAPPYPCIVLGPSGELLFTLNWYATVTPSGHGKIMCHYKQQWEYTFPT